MLNKSIKDCAKKLKYLNTNSKPKFATQLRRSQLSLLLLEKIFFATKKSIKELAKIKNKNLQSHQP